MRKLAYLLAAALLSFSSFAQTSPLIDFDFGPFQKSSDGETVTVTAVLQNKSGGDVRDIDVDLALNSSGKPVTFTASNPPGGQLWSCANDGAQKIRCRLSLIHGSPGFEPAAPLILTIHPAKEGRFALTGQAAWKSGETTLRSEVARNSALYERRVIVTNTRDGGEGSLRAAIEYANDVCARDRVPCAVLFELTEPLPQTGWYTIRPQTPLPAITSPDISIRRVSFFDPHVELDGSLLATGHGLQLRGEGPAEIQGLTIGGFPWDGIAITRRNYSYVFNNLIGIHPNNEPNGNGSRGVTIDPPASDVMLALNRIQANFRSGVFIWGGDRITLDFNNIGFQPKAFNANPLLANGASGVLAGPESRDVKFTRNFIGGNKHMGIAVARGSRNVRIENTWIDPNAGLEIDHGLDDFSGYVDNRADNALPAPRLTSVVYDPVTQMATISGTFDAPDPNTSWTLTFYGDSMGAWPEFSLPTRTFTGTAFTVSFPWFKASPFRATVSSTEPGEWSTSEFSEQVGSTTAGVRFLRTSR